MFTCNTFYLNTKEYFEQFIYNDEVFIEEDQTDLNHWLFNKTHYKGRLKDCLPVYDFFYWCHETLSKEDDSVTNAKVFSLTSLLFEDDLSVEFSPAGEKTIIKTDSSVFEVPKLNVKANGVS